ncbi:MAG: hypothetical protein AAFY02_16235 [Pseudomonadota bacterium]
MTKVIEFPEFYKRRILDILIKYRNEKQQEIKNESSKRNLGWQRVARWIIEYDELITMQTDQAGDSKDKIKSLKRCLEDYERAATKTVPDKYFALIEKYLLDASLRKDLKSIIKYVTDERRNYRRSLFSQFFGYGEFHKEYSSAKSMLDSKAFFVVPAIRSVLNISTVLRFRFFDHNVLDVDVYHFTNFASSFKDFSTKGVVRSSGFGMALGTSELERVETVWDPHTLSRIEVDDSYWKSAESARGFILVQDSDLQEFTPFGVSAAVFEVTKMDSTEIFSKQYCMELNLLMSPYMLSLVRFPVPENSNLDHTDFYKQKPLTVAHIDSSDEIKYLDYLEKFLDDGEKEV